jgi:hypothetical protein
MTTKNRGKRPPGQSRGHQVRAMTTKNRGKRPPGQSNDRKQRQEAARKA